MAATIALILGIVSAVITFILMWIFSEFFIPPRYHWSRSGFSVLLIKLSMAGGIAFFVFGFVSNMLLDLLK